MSAPAAIARPALPGGPYLVVGLARSGVAVARALRGVGEQVVGCDGRRVGEEAAAALHAAGVRVRAPDDGVELLDGVRTVVKSPGVPQEAAVIVAARARGIAVVGELEIAWRLLPGRWIAITGSNGKTTTTELVGHIWRTAGLPVAVAGNVGTAVSSLVGTLDPTVTIVCEASSFQLEDTVAFAPEAAVLLNLAEDHLDRHHTVAAYHAAKLQAFARQPASALAIAPPEPARLGGAARTVRFGSLAAVQRALGDGDAGGDAVPSGDVSGDAPVASAADAGSSGRPSGDAPVGGAGPSDRLSGDAPVGGAGPSDRLSGDAPVADASDVGLPGDAGRDAPVGGAGGRVPLDALVDDGGVLRWRGEPLIAAAEIRIRGPHNRQNAMAAAALALAWGLPAGAVREALATFPGVPHRLEEVATVGGVLYVNDSKATNVDAAVTAVRSFERGVHLILGGRGKGASYRPLRGPIAERCAAVYLIGEDAATIRTQLAREPARSGEGATASGAKRCGDDTAAAETGARRSSETLPPLHDCGDLATAVAAARAAARDGDVVLRSPACASFDQYASFEERGDHFRALVAAS